MVVVLLVGLVVPLDLMVLFEDPRTVVALFFCCELLLEEDLTDDELPEDLLFEADELLLDEEELLPEDLPFETDELLFC